LVDGELGPTSVVAVIPTTSPTSGGNWFDLDAPVVLVEVSDAIWMQILVSVAGIVLLTAVAYYRCWSKKADKPKSPALPAPGIDR
jgi:hypothetical protein